MKLTPLEIDSAAWKRARAYIEVQLEKHRKSLEGDKDVIATATLRGQIKALRGLLLLERPEQPLE